MKKKVDYNEMFEKAKKLIKNENKEEGKDLLLELILLDTQVKLNALYELGKIYSYEKNHKAAIECLKKVIEQNGKYKVYAILEIGRIYVFEEEYEKAKEYFKQLLITPNKDVAIYELGKVAEIEKDYETAIKYYEQVLDNEYSILSLARLYYALGDLDNSKKYYEILIQNNAKNKTNAMFEIAKIYGAGGDRKTAQANFEKLIKMNAKNKIPSTLELAKLYISEGKNEIAKSYLNQLTGTSYEKYAIEELARIAAKEGQEEYARKVFVDMLNNEFDTYTIINLIYLDIKIGNLEEIKELLKILPTDTKYYYNIEAYILYELGEREKINKNNYFVKQLSDFNNEKTLEHLTRHIDDRVSKKQHTKFDSEIDINKMYEFTKEKIKNMNPVDYAFIERYIIECDYEVATIGNERVNCIEVITMPRSKNILTLYPVRIMKNHEKVKVLKK